MAVLYNSVYFLAHACFCSVLKRMIRIVGLATTDKLSTQHLSVSIGWSGGAMVLGKLPVPGRPKI